MAKKKPKVSAKKKPIFPDSEVLEEIRKSYKKKKLIPFIGAGFSRNIKDFPGWNVFIKELTDDLPDEDKECIPKGKTLRDVFGKDNPRATEYYVYKMGDMKIRKHDSDPSLRDVLKEGKTVLEKKLEDKFDDVKYNDEDPKEQKGWRVHRKFIELKNFETIYTTNWDQTLEEVNNKVLRKQEQYEAVFTCNMLNNFLWAGHKRLLIKYHGDYRFGWSLVASESDYFHRLMHPNMMDIRLFHDLLNYDFLFMGFSFEDVFIRLTIHQANDMLKRGVSQADEKDQPDEKKFPKKFMVHVGKPNHIMVKYFELIRVKSLNICELCNCKYLKEIKKPEDCEKLNSNNRCSLRDYFVGFFEKLKEVE